ncbi:hypothetical protein [Hyella patelloides]|nr:hypothetical protein [Hyella patelloides]
MRTNKVHELHRIAHQKYGCIIPHHVLVTFFGVEGNGKTSKIAIDIR